MKDEPEEVLAGGDMTPVVRVADTVRRASGPWTPTIHAFMRHLRAAGFTMVPEPLGMDDRGREIISFLPGAPATYPLPDFAWAEETLCAVAHSLRAFHDASLGFVAPSGGRWQLPAHEPAEVICHNDYAPYNLMFQDGKLTGVIDLDLASPGPRVWDMAYTAYRFAP
jgi:Ser/Thr protein kinase RdoA (MazF antagonist)